MLLTRRCHVAHSCVTTMPLGEEGKRRFISVAPTGVLVFCRETKQEAGSRATSPGTDAVHPDGILPAHFAGSP